MKASLTVFVSVLIVLFILVPEGAKAAVQVSQVTITDNGGSGCNKTKTSSVATVPSSRIAHSLTIDWTHYITLVGVIGGIHAGTVFEPNTNAATHADPFNDSAGTNIHVYAEADFSMMYCSGAHLIELNWKRKDDQAC